MTVADTLSGNSISPTYCGIVKCYTLTNGNVR